ncbi:E1 ubiquitin-activating protein aos1 [Saitoella coloradoensis]
MEEKPDVPPIEAISADEIALYDRQIRLWGLQAQQRLRNANILLISLHALAAETAKNLVLAGIGRLTLLDPHPISSSDLGANFFLEEDDIDAEKGGSRGERMVERVKRLNPRVEVVVDTGLVGERDEDFFGGFDMVVATELGFDELVKINQHCRNTNTPFYAAATHGLYGYIFADLGLHTYALSSPDPKAKVVPGQTPPMITTQHTKSWDPLSTVLSEERKEAFGKGMRPKFRKRVSPVLPALLATWYIYPHIHPDHPEPIDPDPIMIADFSAATHSAARSLGLDADVLVTESFVESWVSGFGTELSPVAAVVGGVLAQDVLNVLSGREEPLRNLFVFDGEQGGVGPIYSI